MAEWAFHYDPPTTVGKLRLFAELLAKLVAARNAVEILPADSFDTVLRILRNRGVLPRQPADLFHYLRRVGNAAVHDNVGTPAEALTALKLARQLGVWFVRSYGKDKTLELGPFRPPQPPENATEALTAEIDRLQRALRDEQSVAEAARQSAEAEARARETADQKAAREAEERVIWETLAAEQVAANVALASQLEGLRERAEAITPGPEPP